MPETKKSQETKTKLTREELEKRGKELDLAIYDLQKKLEKAVGARQCIRQLLEDFEI